MNQVFSVGKIEIHGSSPGQQNHPYSVASLPSLPCLFSENFGRCGEIASDGVLARIQPARFCPPRKLTRNSNTISDCGVRRHSLARSANSCASKKGGLVMIKSYIGSGGAVRKSIPPSINRGSISIQTTSQPQCRVSALAIAPSPAAGSRALDFQVFHCTLFDTPYRLYRNHSSWRRFFRTDLHHRILNNS